MKIFFWVNPSVIYILIIIIIIFMSIAALFCHPNFFPSLSLSVVFFGFSFLHFFVDTKLADPVPNLEHGPCGGSSFGNLGLESPSSSFNGRDSGVKYTYNQNSSLHDNMTIHGLHEDFKNIFGGGTSIKDKQWLKLHISFGLQNLVELDNGLNLLKQGVTFNENEAKSNFSSRNEFCSSAFISFSSVVNDKTVSGRQQVKNDSLQTLSSDDNRVGFCILDSGEKDLLVTQKRLRKPTRRYIEEPSEQKGKYHSRKCGISYKRSRDKFPHVGSHEQHRQAGFGASSLDCQQGFFEGACIQVPFGLPVQEGCSKRNTSILVSMFLLNGLHESLLYVLPFHRCFKA